MIPAALLEQAGRTVREAARPARLGRVSRVAGQIIEARLPGVRIGDLIEIERHALDADADATASANAWLLAEVVGFREGAALAVPLSPVRGVVAGAPVRPSRHAAGLPVSDDLLGRLVDPFGVPLDGGPAIRANATAVLERAAPPVERRAPIDQRFDTGVRTIDGLLTCGRGQRVGLFAGAGVGKTVLIRQIAEQSVADVVVLGLIGERGCEVEDLLASSLGKRSVIVAATSDRSPMERARGALAATAVAEHFRDRGKNVLLVIDSLTRYAMALREIGLAAAEPPATKGYPPSVFAAMPRLLERVAPLRGGGSITGFYTVLVEGDDLSDPVADSARSLLDGHLVLSRDLAARGHFPAIDVLASASRVAHRVSDKDAQQLARRARTLLSVRREAEELRSLGAYAAGTNPRYDEALALAPRFDEWSRQAMSERTTYAESIQGLVGTLGKWAS